MLYTFGWTFFLLPYQIVTGGVTGVAAVIYYGTGIPIYFSYFIINAILLVAALKILGLKFMVKTIYAIGMLSVLLALAEDSLDGSSWRVDTDIRTRTGLHVAHHRLLLHGSIACHRILGQR